MVRLSIDSRSVGEGSSVFMIAEAGVNHNGDIQHAHRLIDAAVEAGADAVKFQTFITEENVAPGAPLAGHHTANVGEELSHFELLKKLELSFEAFSELKTHCETKGVVFISTPYDLKSAEFLIGLRCAAVKIASSEMSNFALLELLGTSKTPVILSTGMSQWSEIVESVDFLRKFGGEICLLKCTSNYPASPESINLRGLIKMRDAFPDCVIGFSDHTVGIEISLAALAFGAAIIERHFTLDRDAWGPDHQASLTADEFGALVESIRVVERALGNRDWDIQEEEHAQRNAMWKGVYARHAIRQGETINQEDVMFLRPPSDLSPKEFHCRYAGKKAARDIVSGVGLTHDLFTAKDRESNH